MDDAIHENEWVLVDTETTGLYPPISTVEIAAQLFRGFVPFGQPFQVIVNPGAPIPPDSTAIHGYTDEYVQQHGTSPVEAYGYLNKYIGDRRIAAHYARFDWDSVLVPETQKLGIKLSGRLGFCTWSLARRALPECPTHRLDSLRDRYGLIGSRPHTALGDVEATTDLLTRFIFPRLSACGFPAIQDIAYFSKLLPLQLCHLLSQGIPEVEAYKRLGELRQEQRARKAKERDLIQFIEAVECREIPLLEAIHQHCLIDEHPIVEFRDRCFLFTGRLAMGTRATAQAAVTARGGTLAKSKAVANAVDYLVLGAENWRELEFGGKLMAAVVRRLKGMPNPTLLLEEDFVAALNERSLYSGSKFR